MKNFASWVSNICIQGDQYSYLECLQKITATAFQHKDQGSQEKIKDLNLLQRFIKNEVIQLG